MSFSSIYTVDNDCGFSEWIKDRITPKVISNSGINQCPFLEESKATLEEITNEISNILQPYSVPNQCGDGLWYRVAYLNMSDPSQQCPSAWREYTSDGIRVCARPSSSGASCPGTLYPVNHQYSKVCGRVIGYQFGSPSAFEMAVINSLTIINEAYLDGIGITHGSPRNHIWSYAAGASERNRQGCFHINCPCSGGRDPPSFLLEITTIASQLMTVLLTAMLSMCFFLMIHSGMVNSVTMRAHVALVPTLHHGSVWSSLTVQVMILRCTFVMIKILLMKILLFNRWNSMSNKTVTYIMD